MSARHVGFGPCVLLLAAALLVNTLAGPLVLDLVDYPISETVLNQLIGLELVTTFLVVPIAVLAGVHALRGRPGAPLLAVGPSAYTAYMFLQYVLGPEYPTYSLTVLFHIAVFALSLAVLVWAWTLARAEPVPVTTPRQQRFRALVLGGCALFVLARYASAFAGSVTGAEISRELQDEPTFYWSIVLLDLGVVVPAALVAAFAVRRGLAFGERAVYAVLGWFALVPASVAAMAAVMLARDDPNASWASVVGLSAAAVVVTVLTVRLFVPVLRDPVTAERLRRVARSRAFPRDRDALR